ncbi:MAG: hypothetical protein HQL49_00695 [Gammaproteobacteria bacterium]|nr:hypothetical protein [Gammaproteobacteria bacterium]
MNIKDPIAKQLSDNFATLDTRLRQLASEVTDVNGHQGDLVRQIGELHTMLDGCLEQLHDHTAQLDNNRAALNDTSFQESLQAAMSALASDSKRIEAQIAKLEIAAASWLPQENELNQLKQNHSSTAQTVTQLQASLNTIFEQSREQQQQQSEVGNSQNELQQQLEQLSVNVDALNTALKQRQIASDKNQDQLQQSLNTLSQDLAAVSESVLALQQPVTQLQENLTTLESTLGHDLCVTNESVEQLKTQQGQKFIELENRVSRESERLGKLQRLLDSRLNHLEERDNATTDNLRQIHQQLSQHDNRHADAQQQQQQRSTQLQEQLGAQQLKQQQLEEQQQQFDAQQQQQLHELSLVKQRVTQQESHAAAELKRLVNQQQQQQLQLEDQNLQQKKQQSQLDALDHYNLMQGNELRRLNDQHRKQGDRVQQQLISLKWLTALPLAAIALSSGWLTYENSTLHTLADQHNQRIEQSSMRLQSLSAAQEAVTAMRQRDESRPTSPTPAQLNQLNSEIDKLQQAQQSHQQRQQQMQQRLKQLEDRPDTAVNSHKSEPAAQRRTDKQTTTGKVSAKKKVPATATVASPQITLLDKRWLEQQPEKNYTIQLLACSNNCNIPRFIRQSENNDETLASVCYQQQGKTWQILLQGSYPNQQSAKAAAAALSQSYRQNRPWIRTIEAVRQQIK